MSKNSHLRKFISHEPSVVFPILNTNSSDVENSIAELLYINMHNDSSLNDVGLNLDSLKNQLNLLSYNLLYPTLLKSSLTKVAITESTLEFFSETKDLPINLDLIVILKPKIITLKLKSLIYDISEYKDSKLNGFWVKTQLLELPNKYAEIISQHILWHQSKERAIISAN